MEYAMFRYDTVDVKNRLKLQAETKDKAKNCGKVFGLSIKPQAQAQA